MSGPGDFVIGYSAIGDTGKTAWPITLAVFAALTRKVNNSWPTIAQDQVYLPRDWPVQQAQVPILKIMPPTEIKEGQGNAGINFETTATVELVLEVSRPAEPDDIGAAKLLTGLTLFQREVELAVIGDPTLFGGAGPGLVERLRSVQTKTVLNDDGTLHRGAMSMIFDFVFFQGTEDFQQPQMTDLDRFHLYADLINVADPSGTYVPPMDYVPTPAPRTAGPDGRVEGEAEVIPPS